MDALLQSQVRKLLRRGMWGRVYTSAGLAAGAYRTDVNITGQGYLLYVATSASSSGQERLRITIDGNAANTIGTANVYVATSGTTSVFGKLFVFLLPFKSSLKIETYNSHSSALSIMTEVDYILAA